MIHRYRPYRSLIQDVEDLYRQEVTRPRMAYLVIGFVIGLIVGISAAFTPWSDTPISKVRCTDISSGDLFGWTAVHELEEELLSPVDRNGVERDMQMVYKFATTLRCRGFVHGHFKEWTADQAMIQRM